MRLNFARRAKAVLGGLFSLALCLCVPVFSAIPVEAGEKGGVGQSTEQADRRVADAPSAKEYPKASAVLFIDDLTYTLNSDFSSVTTEHSAIKVLKAEGVDVAKVVPRPFIEGQEKVELEYARTITPDGKVFNISPESIKIIDSVEGVPLYKDHKIFLAQLPNVAVGSVVEYSLKTTTAARGDHQWWVCSYLQNDIPITHSTLKVSVPEGTDVHTFTNDSSLRAPKVVRRDGRCVYFWSTDRPYDVLPEAVSMPTAGKNYYKYVGAGSFADWPDFGRWMGKIWDENTADPSGALTMLSARITSVGKPARERIQDVLNYMSRYTLSNRSVLGLGCDLKAASESKTLSHYDVAYLTGALLKKAGLKVTPYITTSSDLKTIESNPPNPNFVDQYLLKVFDPTEGVDLWIDPTLPGEPLSAPNLGWQGSALIELGTTGTGKGRVIEAPVAAAEDNSCSYRMEGVIDPSGVGELTADVTHTGPRANVLLAVLGQLKEIGDSQRDEVVTWVVSKFSKNFCFQTIPYSRYFPEQANPGQPFTFNTSVKFVDYARFNKDKQRFETPLPIVGGQSLQAGLAVDKRDYPVRFDAPFVDEINYHLYLPEGSKVVSQPIDKELRNEVGAYICKTVIKDSQIWFYNRVEVYEPWIYKEQFGQLGELAQAQLETMKSPLAYTLPPEVSNNEGSEPKVTVEHKDGVVEIKLEEKGEPGKSGSDSEGEDRKDDFEIPDLPLEE